MMLRQILLGEKNPPKPLRKRRKKSPSVLWHEASDVKSRVDHIVRTLNLTWIHPERIFCFRSHASKARAYARIWGLSQIWQQALETEPAYCLEVLSENFDKLSIDKKDEVLIHELVHIPETFSGSLRPHMKRGKWKFHDTVDELVAQYKKASR